MNVIKVNKIKYFGSVILSVGIALSTQAQNGKSSPSLFIDLNKAIELANKNYPSIKAKEAEKQAAQKEVNSVRSEYLPALLLQDQYTYASANGAVGTFWPNEGYAMPTSGATRSHNIYTGAFGSYSTIAVNWPVFSFGKIRSRVNLAKSEVNQANLEYENEIFQHQVKVIDAYLLLLVYQKLVKVQEQNLNRAQILKNTISAATSSGMRPGVDSSFANAELSRTKILFLQSKSNERATRIKLSELIGSEGDSIIIDSMLFYNHLPEINNQSQWNINNNPVLKVYQSRIEVGVRRSVATMRSYFPCIKLLAAGIGRGSGISNTNDLNYSQNFFSGVGFKTYNYLLGVSFLWNIMDYPRIKNAYDREKYLTSARQFEYDEQKLKIKRELENSEIQLNLAEQQAQEAPVQLAAARNGYDQVQSRYRSGLSTLPEVAQNFYILNRAEVDLTVAYNNMWRALLLKAAAAGDLVLFTKEVK